MQDKKSQKENDCIVCFHQNVLASINGIVLS